MSYSKNVGTSEDDFFLTVCTEMKRHVTEMRLEQPDRYKKYSDEEMEVYLLDKVFEEVERFYNKTFSGDERKTKMDKLDNLKLSFIKMNKLI